MLEKRGEETFPPAPVRTFLDWACLGHMTPPEPITVAQCRSGLLWWVSFGHVPMPGLISWGTGVVSSDHWPSSRWVSGLLREVGEKVREEKKAARTQPPTASGDFSWLCSIYIHSAETCLNPELDFALRSTLWSTSPEAASRIYSDLLFCYCHCYFNHIEGFFNLWFMIASLAPRGRNCQSWLPCCSRPVGSALYTAGAQIIEWMTFLHSLNIPQRTGGAQGPYLFPPWRVSLVPPVPPCHPAAHPSWRFR